MKEIPDWVLKQIMEWLNSDRYGYLQLNIQAGKIVNINKHETLKPEP